MSSYTLCLILCYTEARRGDQKDQRCSVTCDSPAYMICHQTLWSFSLYKPKAEHRMLQDSLICTILHIQGGNQLVTKSTAQLWPHFESWWLFEPTGGSPDVVHLIINASEDSELILKFIQKGLGKKSSAFKQWLKSINFSSCVIMNFHSFLFKITKNYVLSRKLILPDVSIAW